MQYAVIEGTEFCETWNSSVNTVRVTAVSQVFDTEVNDDLLDVTLESARLDVKRNGIELKRIDAP